MSGDALLLLENVEIVCSANVPTTANFLVKLLGLYPSKASLETTNELLHQHQHAQSLSILLTLIANGVSSMSKDMEFICAHPSRNGTNSEVLTLTIATATATTTTASGVAVQYLFCYRLCHSLLAGTPWHDEGLNTEVVVTMVHQHSKTDPRDTITAWCRCASRKDGFAHQSCISSIGRASLPRRAGLAPCSGCPAQLLLHDIPHD